MKRDNVHWSYTNGKWSNTTSDDYLAHVSKMERMQSTVDPSTMGANRYPNYQKIFKNKVTNEEQHVVPAPAQVQVPAATTVAVTKADNHKVPVVTEKKVHFERAKAVDPEKAPVVTVKKVQFEQAKENDGVVKKKPSEPENVPVVQTEKKVHFEQAKEGDGAVKKKVSVDAQAEAFIQQKRSTFDFELCKRTLKGYCAR